VVFVALLGGPVGLLRGLRGLACAVDAVLLVVRHAACDDHHASVFALDRVTVHHNRDLVQEHVGGELSLYTLLDIVFPQQL